MAAFEAFRVQYGRDLASSLYSLISEELNWARRVANRLMKHSLQSKWRLVLLSKFTHVFAYLDCLRLAVLELKPFAQGRFDWGNQAVWSSADSTCIFLL